MQCRKKGRHDKPRHTLPAMGGMMQCRKEGGNDKPRHTSPAIRLEPCETTLIVPCVCFPNRYPRLQARAECGASWLQPSLPAHWKPGDQNLRKLKSSLTEPCPGGPLCHGKAPQVPLPHACFLSMPEYFDFQGSYHTAYAYHAVDVKSGTALPYRSAAA